MTFKQRPEGNEGVISLSLWDKSVLGRGRSIGKGPGSLACSRSDRNISMAGVEGGRDGGRHSRRLGHTGSQGQIRWGPTDSHKKFCFSP